MKSITKIRIVLTSIVIALVLSISKINYNQISNNETSNILDNNSEEINLEQIEPKMSGDNEYTRVWDTDDAISLFPRGLYTGDHDSDGKDEIVVGTNDYLHVLEYNSTYNNYSMVFTSEDLTDALYTVWSGDDLDRDGKKEIMTGSSSGILYAFEHDGTDDNGYDKIFEKYYGADTQIDEMCIGNDLDRDGEKEIIVGAGRYVNISEFNGVDNVYDEVWVSVNLGQYVSDVFSSDDLDEDGNKEIIATTYDEIFIFENSGDNAYIGVWNRTKDFYCVCIGNDLDGDGKKEIIAGTGGTDEKLYIFEYNGTNNGYEEVWNSTLTTTIGDDVYSICTGEDLDGDGKKEIIVGSGSTAKKLYIFEYNGTDNGYSKVWDSGSTINGIVYSICIGDDLDKNGKKEIIASCSDSKVYIFEYDDTIPSQRAIIIIDDDDDDDDDDDEDIFIKNQPFIIIGAISAVVIVGVVIILIKIKSGSGR